MSNAISKTLDLMTGQEKRRMAGVFLVMLVAAAFEVAGIGSVFPFLNVLTDPSQIQESSTLSFLYNYFGFQSSQSFLVALGLGVLGIIVGTQAIQAYSTWLQTHFAADVGHDLSVRLLDGYLQRPYTFHLQRNTADLSKNVLQDVGKVVNGVLRPGMSLISKAVVAIGIFGYLLWLDPVITISLVVFIGGSYVALYAKIRKKMREKGEERNEMLTARYQITDEAFGGIEDLKVLGREPELVDRYAGASRIFADNEAKRLIYQKLPGFLLRGLTFGGMMAILLFLMVSGMPVEGIVPLVGTIAFAGYRLMPTFQQMLSAFTSFSYHGELVEDIYRDLSRSPDSTGVSDREQIDPLPLEEEIRFDEVTFQYETADEVTLDEISLTIPEGSSVAFVGETGAGKSTTISLMLGLIEPDRGEILVDGESIHGEILPRWQKSIGYVPQDVFLADASVAENIAFGLPEDEIDHQAVRNAAQVAHIHDFIDGELPEGYETEVGERGVRLSGGQKQRIGIARALYHDPEVVVFDEATSDIDRKTEAEISEAIDELSAEKTLVTIAHRLQTVRSCDKIFVLGDGKLVAQGDYESLVETSPRFRRLAQGLEQTEPRKPGTR